MADIPISTGQIVHLKRGELLFKENDESNEFFIVKKGRIRIFRNVEKSVINLDTLGPGMVAGEIAMIASVPRTASGVAVEDTDVIKITRQEFYAVFEKSPDWFRKIALILVQRLREVDEKISQSLDQDFYIPVASLIALVSYTAKACPEGDTWIIDRKFIEYEIMDLLAIPLSEVVNSLETLAAKNLVKLNKDTIILTDRAGCEAL